MKKLCASCFTLTLIASFAALPGAQKSATAPTRAATLPTRPLVLTETIPLEGVKGRFDHFASGGGQLFVAALGNNSLEVINTGGRALARSIPVPDPQGVAYSPETKKIFVGSGTGKLYIYDGTSFDLLTTIDFPGGADNVRYDAATRRVYVACGDDQTGAIAIIDATTNRRLDEEYKLGSQPESFQLETSGPNIYVNLPGLQQIAVINRATRPLPSPNGWMHNKSSPNAAVTSGGRTTTRKRALRDSAASIAGSSHPPDARLPTTKASNVPLSTSTTPSVRRQRDWRGGAPRMSL